jgi:lipoate-protein ligase A
MGCCNFSFIQNAQKDDYGEDLRKTNNNMVLAVLAKLDIVASFSGRNDLVCKDLKISD